MKVIIEGRAFFNAKTLKEQLDQMPVLDASMLDDSHEVKVEIVGSPDEDLDRGQILICHPKVSLELNRGELERALRVFQER